MNAISNVLGALSSAVSGITHDVGIINNVATTVRRAEVTGGSIIFTGLSYGVTIAAGIVGVVLFVPNLLEFLAKIYITAARPLMVHAENGRLSRNFALFLASSYGYDPAKDMYYNGVWWTKLTELLIAVCTVLFLVPFILFRSIYYILKRIQLFFWLAVFIVLFMYIIEAHLPEVFDFINNTLHLGIAAKNLGGLGFNVIFEVDEIFRPITNAVLAQNVKMALAAADIFSTQSCSNGNLFGRRADAITDAGDVVQSATLPIMNAFAFAYDKIGDVTILIATITFDLFGCIAIALIEGINFIFVRAACAYPCFACWGRELATDIIGINFICDPATLATCGGGSGPNCLCAGQGFFNYQSVGIFSQLEACQTRRVLCEMNDLACEFVDGQPLVCHHDVALGCPVTRLAMSAQGNVHNILDLGAAFRGYEVCLNGSSLFHVHDDGWEHVGGCGPGAPHPNARRHLLDTFPDLPPPAFRAWPARPARALAASVTRDQAAATYAQMTGGPLFELAGMQCDLQHSDGTPYQRFVDTMCIAGVVFQKMGTQGGQPPQQARGLSERALELAGFLHTRRLLYDASGGDLSALFETSRATDKWPLFERMAAVAQGFRDVGRGLDALKERSRRHRERARRMDALNSCPDGFAACPDRSCVPIGQEGACPTTCLPGILNGLICQTHRATRAVQTFDPLQYYAGWRKCWDGYVGNPSTYPVGRDDSDAVSVFCFPLRPAISFRFEPSDYNLRQTLRACQDGDVSKCDCPRYYSGEFDYQATWFGSVAAATKYRLLNALIAWQWLVSRVTGQEGPLYFIGAAWEGLFAAFGFPTWWARAFNNLADVPESTEQEALCFSLHLGSQALLMFALLLIVSQVEAWWPLIVEATNVLYFPFDLVYAFWAVGARAAGQRRARIMQHVRDRMHTRRQAARRAAEALEEKALYGAENLKEDLERLGRLDLEMDQRLARGGRVRLTPADWMWYLRRKMLAPRRSV
jgi:hypothetical protein